MGKKKSALLTFPKPKPIQPKLSKKERRRRGARLRKLNDSHLIQELSRDLVENKAAEQVNPKFGIRKWKALLKESQNNDVEIINVPHENSKQSNLRLDKTIDLCDDDEGSTYGNMEGVSIVKDNMSDQSEIMIIAEDLKQPPKILPDTAMVVDLCKEEKTVPSPSNTSNSTLNKNDDIFVVETINKIPFSDSVKKNNWLKNFNEFKPHSKHRQQLRSDLLNNERLNFIMGNNNNNNNMKNERHLCDVYLKSKVLSNVGQNVYTSSPIDIPTSGLRPIIIDGTNVAVTSKKKSFLCKRLETCINYFKERGHKVTAFVPQFRTLTGKCDNPRLLRKMAEDGDVILTPSKRVDGRAIVPYDDRFIVQTAVLKGGIIVTRDNYRDLLMENPAWAETIKYRTLPFTWVDDLLMFPSDPLGERGPTLDQFLRFT